MLRVAFLSGVMTSFLPEQISSSYTDPSERFVHECCLVAHFVHAHVLIQACHAFNVEFSRCIPYSICSGFDDMCIFDVMHMLI